ncbi:class I SAM-dependent methyltransferase [Bacillus gobiensis]|uniref:class I SAM-dependent methyltransferase n=1 Tax=Bacillus gobiensis TaxID=1441095 RepID=UPI003D1E2217
MINDSNFIHFMKHADHQFSGWDFSFLSETGRMSSSLLSWSYGSMAISLIHRAHSMLDMGTGGGEFLSLLGPFTGSVIATEAYKPNVPVAKKMLEPMGINVVSIDGDTDLPFQDSQFDLILNRHESYSIKEVRRILSDNGTFLTQQVGGLDCAEINKNLGVSLNKEFTDWSLSTAIKELRENGFEIAFCKEEFPVQRFYDIGAIVYYLKAIPWQIPDFTIEKYKDQLFQIHQTIQTEGYFDVKQHRFIIQSTAI